MARWPECGHVATAKCKGGWEIKLLTLPTSIGRKRQGWLGHLWGSEQNKNKNGAKIHCSKSRGKSAVKGNKI